MTATSITDLNRLVDRIRDAGTVLELEVALQDARDTVEFPMVAAYWLAKFEEDLVDTCRKYAGTPNAVCQMDLPRLTHYGTLRACLTGYKWKFVKDWYERTH
jgi:hypothetical protein